MHFPFLSADQFDSLSIFGNCAVVLEIHSSYPENNIYLANNFGKMLPPITLRWKNCQIKSGQLIGNFGILIMWKILFAGDTSAANHEIILAKIYRLVR